MKLIYNFIVLRNHSPTVAILESEPKSRSRILSQPNSYCSHPMQQHQVNVPQHLQQSSASKQRQAKNILESGTNIIQNPVDKAMPPITSNLASNEPSEVPREKPIQNVYSNAYSKKSTAELIRQRLNISPSKKKNGQQPFSQSDEMQYKRTTGLKDFQVLQKLGDGAYSSVYKVRRVEDGQVYALKKVKIGAQSHKDKENAINEVRILSSIKHPNVVAYKEAFIDRDSQTLNLVMQLADGGDLLKMISDRKKRKVHFRESQVWRVLIETVYGLRAMHELSVMHRDIKSANIFLFRNNEVACQDGGNLYQSKLGDMNVSKVTNQSGLNYTQTGTPYYASPEVWKDEPYGYKSDVWSLGCVIYEMLSLKPPFSGRDMDHLYKRVCKGIFPRIPDHYSNDIWALVQLMLRVDPAKRPDCNQLIQSKMFQIYTEKLNSLESVDLTFKQTLKSASPDRAQISQITNSLLTQLHLPANDLNSLTKMLPKRNYESAQTCHGKVTSLIKTTSAQVEDPRQLSQTSRKLQHIRNQHQQKEQSRQKTQLQHAQHNSIDSVARVGGIAAKQGGAGKRADSQQKIQSETPSPSKQRPLVKANVQAPPAKGGAVGTVSPKLTKIQTKLQRQYLQSKQTGVQPADEGASVQSEQRSKNNATVITNRSVSKQSLHVNSSDRTSDRDGAGTLRNRLSNKRKQIFKDAVLNSSSVERETEVDSHYELASGGEKAGGVRNFNRNKTTSKKQPSTASKKAMSLAINVASQEGKQSLALHQELSHQNQSSVKMGPDQDLSPSPFLDQSHKNSTMKQNRLNLPLVSLSQNRIANSLPGSTESTPVHQAEPSGLYTGLSPALKNQVMSLPQLSEIESENVSQAELKLAKIKPKLAGSRSKDQSRVSGVQAPHHYHPDTVKPQREDVDILEGDYSKLGHSGGPQSVSNANNYGAKLGKRHASYDMLLPQNSQSQALQVSQPSAQGVHPTMAMPAGLVASQGTIPVQLQAHVTDMQSNRLPESHSYSQINMINKKNIVGLAKNLGSTSSSDERAAPQNSVPLHGSLQQHASRYGHPPHPGSETKVHHQSLRKRYNNKSGHHSSSHAGKDLVPAHPSAIINSRPSIHSQQPSDPYAAPGSGFKAHQQASVRHQYSDANFSLNSEELRHAAFQNSLQQHQLASLLEEGKTSTTARLHVESNKVIKLPQIEGRKKSYETGANGHGQASSNDHRKIHKLNQAANLKQALITKKKPGGHVHQLAASMVHKSLKQVPVGSQSVLPMAQSLSSSTHLSKLSHLNVSSPANHFAPVGPGSGIKQMQPAQTIIKKKTLAAYANPRVRNQNRNNLIYTQKQSI